MSLRENCIKYRNFTEFPVVEILWKHSFRRVSSKPNLELFQSVIFGKKKDNQSHLPKTCRGNVNGKIFFELASLDEPKN